MRRPAYRGVLFDLDGTLADTAPDLIAALDHVRGVLNLPPADSGELRAMASRGAVSILDAGLPELAAENRSAHRERFLDFYRANCWTHSRPFDGIETLLGALDEHSLPWAVVTNKLESLARPVLEQAGWLDRVACLVAGDSGERPKPAPDPVLLACRKLGLEPREILFVGDDRRDIIAGQAAGAATAVALWGYIAEFEDPREWNADWMIERPGDLHSALFEAAER